MPRVPVGLVRDQIRADREFTAMIYRQEIAGIPTPIEVPSDAEYARQLHEEINEASQLAGEQSGEEVTQGGERDEPATSSDDELWEINSTNELVLTDEEIAEIREKYGILSFVGMEVNPSSHR